MSAFLVDQTNLYRMIYAITKIESFNNELKAIKEKAISKPKELFKELNYLNKYSLSERYSDEVLDNVQTYPFNLNDYNKETLKTNDFQNLKSLKCFLYQSCEGNASKTDLYKLLNKISKDIAFNIINNIEEYKKAKWE